MSLLLKKFRILIWSFSEFPYYNVGDITSAKGYPHYDWPATYAVSLFINNLYTVTSLIVKSVTKRRKSNNQIVLNCLHQHNLMTIEGRTKLFSAIPQPTKILYLIIVLFALFLCSHSVAYKKAPLSAPSSQYLCRRIKITINHKYHALGERALPHFFYPWQGQEAVASPLIIIARLFPRPEYSLFSHSFVARGWSAPLFFTCQPCRPYTPV